MNLWRTIVGGEWAKQPGKGVVRRVRQKNLTYLEEGALMDLFMTVQEIVGLRIEGRFIETGCALGGSSVVIASAKEVSRIFNIYDVFGMIPSPNEKDGADVQKRYQTIVEGKSEGINGEEYYGYKENLLETVKCNFSMFGLDVAKNNIHLIKGLYQDTLKVNYPVAFAHIDCDWYESVKVCLEQIVPNLSPGGVIVVDDYYVWSGCTRAVDEYFSGKKDKFEFVRKQRLHVIKR